MSDIGKILIFTGIFIAITGLLIVIASKTPLPIGKLPGDIYIKRDNFSFYFPVSTCILLSIMLSFLIFLFSLLRK